MEITRGKILKPQKVVIYGPEGIGKTSLAARFLDPLFCDTEGGSHQLDVARTPVPSSWTMLLEIVQSVIRDPSLCRTFVLDTADWAERLCVQHVCSVHDQKGIESFGYGKGYVYVYEEFGKLLNLLSDLIERGITVVVTAHAQLRKFEQPDELGSYDRYELKLSKKTGAQVADMLKEWSDLLLFVNYKTVVINVDGQGATKGKNKAQGGQRVMYTTHTPSWDAKNRHSLPEELPMDYGAIAHLFAHTIAPPPPVSLPAQKSPDVKLPERVETLKNDLDKEVQSGRLHPDDAVAMVEIVNKHNATSKTFPSPQDDGIPQALRDLMSKDGVTEQEIMFAVASKGYYPNATPISQYDPAFVAGVLVAAWPQVQAMVMENREKVPF
ncbi:MAG: ATP-binding protein [Candidatus Limiplasma sp.]|nr:ATP-binding protein [Candidatus Limiplasma sp.]